MRDLLIVSIVLVGAGAAVFRPWIGVQVWTWLSIMNPHRYAWGLAYSAPLAAIAAASTLLGLVMTPQKQSPFKGPAVWWLLVLFVWITVSWLLGIDPSGDYGLWDRVMKIYLMTFVALALLHTKHHVLAFAWVTIMSIGILAAKGGLFTIATGGNYRVWGPPESFIADNNDFALATVVATPMLYFLRMQVTNRWLRHALLAAVCLCVASAVGSQSRGALLALAAMGTVFWWRSNSKVAIGCMIALAVLLFLPMMPESWWERMGTIGTYDQDASALGRINAWKVAIAVANDYFFGGGMSYQHKFLFEQYGDYETTVRAAHSIYFQILGNHGYIGLFLFLAMWACALHSARWLSLRTKDIPQARWAQQLGAMAQASLIGYAVGGAFLSLPYFDLPYNIMVMIVVARKWVENRAWETDTAGIPRLAFIGLGPPTTAPSSTPEPAPAAGKPRHHPALRRRALVEAATPLRPADTKSRR